MKKIIATVLLLITNSACVSTQVPVKVDTAESVFAEYCHNGKQIKKMGIEFEVIEPKCRKGITVFECADKLQKFWNDYPIEDLWGYYYKTLLEGSFVKMEDKESFLVQEASDIYSDMPKSKFVQFPNGDIIFSKSCLYEKHCMNQDKIPYKESLMLNAYAVNPKNSKNPSLTYFYIIKSNQEQRKTDKNKPSLVQTTVKPSALGKKYTISIDMNIYCKQAVHQREYLVQ
jgi:hypothetical protein